MKYDFKDARYVLERASARESAARVASGAFAKLLLKELGVGVASHVIRVGHAELERDATWDEIAALRMKEEVLLGCVDAEAGCGREIAALSDGVDTSRLRRHTWRRKYSLGKEDLCEQMDAGQQIYGR